LEGLPVQHANLSISSAFVVALRKTTGNLDCVGRSVNVRIERDFSQSVWDAVPVQHRNSKRLWAVRAGCLQFHVAEVPLLKEP
jgi:hypothetical protein